jgi:hypothetical protein
MITLHVKLLDTPLANFVEHFERGFHEYIRYAIAGGLLATRWDDEPVISPSEARNFFAPLEKVGIDTTVTVIRARRELKGHTQRNYVVFKDDGPLSDLRGHFFTLNAIQFGRHLKIVMAEYTDTPIHGQKMLEWIGLQWGKNGYELVQQDADTTQLADDEFDPDSIAVMAMKGAYFRLSPVQLEFFIG